MAMPEKTESENVEKGSLVKQLQMRPVHLPTSKGASSRAVRGAPLKMSVLVVGDERTVWRATGVSLRTPGIHNVLTSDGCCELLQLLSEAPVGVLVVDLSMPHTSGRKFLERVAAERPDIPIMIMTEVTEADSAADRVRTEGTDHFVGPVDNDCTSASAMRALETGPSRDELYSLKENVSRNELKHPEAFVEVISENEVMRSLFQYVEAIAPSEQPVLISGETGTGKGLFAGAIHRLSQCTGKMIAVNVEGLDDKAFSEVLFGRTNGAVSGTDRMRDGVVAEAAGGTLFFDEIGDLNEASQLRLLRLLQDSAYDPPGSVQQRIGQTRIVVATNRDLQAGMNDGAFRKDLYYRLRAHHIHVPPLRARKEDLPGLVAHFLERAAASLGKKTPKLPAELLDLLRTYHFPGNIRELQAMTHDSVAQHPGGILSLKSFRAAIGQGHIAVQRNMRPDDVVSKFTGVFGDRLPTLAESEEFLMSQALRLAKGNQSNAARMLGLTRQALNKRLVRRRNKADLEGE